MVIPLLKGALSAAGCYALLGGGEVCGGHLGALEGGDVQAERLRLWTPLGNGARCGCSVMIA